MRLSHTAVNAQFAQELRSSQWLPVYGLLESRRMDVAALNLTLRRLGKTQRELAEAMGFTDASIVNKGLKGKRGWKVEEAAKLEKILRRWESEAADAGSSASDAHSHMDNTSEFPEDDPALSYVEVEVLPTFGGMGGGGTGDGPRATALVARNLVYGELRAKEGNLLIINVRGTSMEPLFKQNDQLIIDRREVDPSMAGPFALRIRDSFLIKNLSWTKSQKLRVGSINAEFPEELWDPNDDDIEILGRPVWFARRL